VPLVSRSAKNPDTGVLVSSTAYGSAMGDLTRPKTLATIVTIADWSSQIRFPVSGRTQRRMASHSCPSGEEPSVRIKQAYLILTFFVVAALAALYGISPQWFANRFLGVTELDRNLAHILRAVMGLYLGMGLFWLFAAASSKHRNTAVLTTLIFAAGLASGRIISLVADGMPSRLLVASTVAELVIVPIAYWVYRLPEA
jgi:hypothetical protein